MVFIRDSILPHMQSCPGGSVVKNPPANAGDTGLIPGSGRSSGEGNGHLLQYSCPKNPMDRGAWWTAVHGVANSWIWLNNWAHTYLKELEIGPEGDTYPKRLKEKKWGLRLSGRTEFKLRAECLDVTSFNGPGQVVVEFSHQGVCLEKGLLSQSYHFFPEI